MLLDSSFAVLLQGLCVGMTAPTSANFVVLLTGWVFAPRRTVTNILLAARVAGDRHHAAFHRFFSRAVWSLDMLSLAVFRLILTCCNGVIHLSVDDTLARKRGLKVFGAGMHHDPLLSSRGMAVMNWGHCWVVLSVIVIFPLWPDRPFSLPVLFRLYLNKQLPTPDQMLDQRSRRIELAIYGRNQSARVNDTLARMYALPERELRIVAVEAVSGGRGREAFYSTSVDATAESILTWYSQRWSIEVAFQDSKQHLGFEEPQGWTRRAVERTAPTAMLLYSLIVYWYATEGHRHFRPLERPWYTTKTRESFADMLATLRRKSLRESISAWAPTGPGSQKITDLLEGILALAA